MPDLNDLIANLPDIERAARKFVADVRILGIFNHAPTISKIGEVDFNQTKFIDKIENGYKQKFLDALSANTKDCNSISWNETILWCPRSQIIESFKCGVMQCMPIKFSLRMTMLHLSKDEAFFNAHRSLYSEFRTLFAGATVSCIHGKETSVFVHQRATAKQVKLESSSGALHCFSGGVQAEPIGRGPIDLGFHDAAERETREESWMTPRLNQCPVVAVEQPKNQSIDLIFIGGIVDQAARGDMYSKKMFLQDLQSIASGKKPVMDHPEGYAFEILDTSSNMENLVARLKTSSNWNPVGFCSYICFLFLGCGQYLDTESKPTYIGSGRSMQTLDGPSHNRAVPLDEFSKLALDICGEVANRA